MSGHHVAQWDCGDVICTDIQNATGHCARQSEVQLDDSRGIFRCNDLNEIKSFRWIISTLSQLFLEQ